MPRLASSVRSAWRPPCLLPGTPAGAVAVVPGGETKTLSVEHPSGETSAVLTVDAGGKRRRRRDPCGRRAS